MSGQYHRLVSLLEDLDLKEDIVSFLEKNGFDDWETLRELTLELLRDLGTLTGRL